MSTSESHTIPVKWCLKAKEAEDQSRPMVIMAWERLHLTLLCIAVGKPVKF